MNFFRKLIVSLKRPKGDLTPIYPRPRKWNHQIYKFSIVLVSIMANSNMFPKETIRFRDFNTIQLKRIQKNNSSVLKNMFKNTLSYFPLNTMIPVPRSYKRNILNKKDTVIAPCPWSTNFINKEGVSNPLRFVALYKIKYSLFATHKKT